MKHYECVICLNVNHASRYQCSTCGTIPAQYSILAKPARFISHDFTIACISVVVAFGARRQEHGHTTKSQMRTVPLDYYASA